MTERASRPDVEYGWLAPERSEVDEVAGEMTRLLAIAVNSRQSGESVDIFAPKQAEATNFINRHWPGDKTLHISFSSPTEVFTCGREFGPNKVEESLMFRANRHAGFGQRGAIFVNDIENKSVYVSEFFSTKLQFR